MNSWFSRRNGDSTIVHIRDEIGCGSSASDFLTALGEASKIEIFLNSCGGSTTDGLAIFDGLKDRDVEVTVTGRCFSAAVPILLAGRVRRIHAGARVMIHRPVDYCLGDVDELECAARGLGKVTARLADVIAARAGQASAVVQGWLAHGQDKYFCASEALACGLVTEIVEPMPASALEATEAPAGLLTPTPKTDAELLFGSMLAAFDDLPVANREEFLRELNVFATYRVKEIG